MPHNMTTTSSSACRPISANSFDSSGSQLGIGSASNIWPMRLSRSRQTMSPA